MATAVDKTVNQPGTKHHGITKKLKQGFTRSEAHRRALATTAQPRRRCCRPRGRRAWSASSQRSQASRMVWLSTQGTSGAMASITGDWRVLWRRQKLNGVRLRRWEKIEEEENRRRRRLGFYNAAQKLKEATQELFLCQHKAEDGHDTPGTPEKVAGHVASAVNTVHLNYQTAIRFKFQITPKFVEQLKNLQK